MLEHAHHACLRFCHFSYKPLSFTVKMTFDTHNQYVLPCIFFCIAVLYHPAGDLYLLATRKQRELSRKGSYWSAEAAHM